MIKALRKSKIISIITFVLIVNFINLTANFYHPGNLNSLEQSLNDPIDTLAEIIVEFIFEMDNQIIPDTDVPHEKKKIPDIKLAFTKNEIKVNCYFTFELNKWRNSFDVSLTSGIDKENSPPPETFTENLI
ncbi:hypothetical protein [Belliella aquatica]|uniref:Uncharacterized protein n=1 Tax=Belliella aquatica TaxID=1323734 RepID=A0ABQ1MGG8_9BACT|nr:hypothetical protein [Belliella aquatica]MCH7405220.1 hypothetical protein [Belliella aquatica]GGC38777.1 hypothetical protein GCM10010993_16950 [Belliella aquatica]